MGTQRSPFFLCPFQALDRAIVDLRESAKWATDKPWSMKYADFTATEEKNESRVNPCLNYSPARDTIQQPKRLGITPRRFFD